MDEKSRNSVREIFLEAAERGDPQARAAYLDKACASDESLRRRVEVLLAAEAEAGGPPTEAPSSDQFSSDPALGGRIGHYKLLQQIGEGGCGVVFMAEQEQPVRRKVALKVIKLGMDTKQVVARFEAERQALAMMDHPNIAKVFDAGTVGEAAPNADFPVGAKTSTDVRTSAGWKAGVTGRPYFVMELVRGIKITDYCDQHQFSTRQRLDLFIQVCHAVQHAHQKGIIHRDLKPSNILVTELDGVPLPKIIDFGIAKAVEGRLTDQTLFTAFEQFIGTPAYMSPEQAALSATDIDTRSDIYSLGVLLYELLTGKTPFDSKALLSSGLDAMRQTIREKEPLRPSNRLHTLSGQERTTTARSRGTEVLRLIHLIRGDLDWIVMKCLEKERKRRYDTANGLAEDLQRHLENEPVLARPPSRLYEFQKSVRRHKLGFAATAVVMLVLMAGVLASSWEASRARRNAQLARYRAYVSDMRVARDALGEGDIGRARRLLRRYIPQPGDNTDLRQWEWRELAYECRPDEHFSLGPFPRELSNVKFLNQDTLLTTTVFTDRTYLWNWKEQRLAKVLTNAQERVVGPAAFSPARHGMFWRRGMSGVPDYVRFTDLQTGLETNLSFLGRVVSRVAISPDGRLLAVCHQDNAQGRIEVWDLEHQTNVVRLSMSSLPARFELRFSPDGTRLAGTDTAGRLSLWNAGQWSLLARTKVALPSQLPPALEFSPNSKWIVTAGKDWKVKIWDAHSGSFLRELPNAGHSDVFAFSPDSTTLASGGVDRDIKLWDTSTWKVKRVLRGHTDEVSQMDFSPDGRWLASGSLDGEVNVWPLSNSAPTLDRVRRFGQPSVAVLGAPDGTRFIRTLDPQFKLFELCRAPGFEPVAFRPPAVSGATFISAILLAGSARAVAGYDDGLLRIGSLSGVPHFTATSKETGPTEGLAAARDGTTLVSFAVVKPQWDRTSVSIWRLPGLELITNKVVDGVWWGPAAVSEDARHLAIYSPEGYVEVWDIPSMQGHPPWRVSGKARDLTAMRFSPDGKLLATACSDGSNYIWDYAHRRAVTALPTIRPNIRSFSFSPDGARLAVGALDEVRLFDVKTGEEMAALSAPEIHHVQAVFSQNGQDLIAFGRDGVRVWHAPPLEKIKPVWLKTETSRNASNLK